MNVESIIQLIYADKLLTKLRKKIEAGQGTFKDTTDYCNRSAELLGRLFSENVLSMSDVERITANDTLLKDRYKDINDLLDKVQRTVDKKQGINIRPQHAPFNQERADQIGRALTDKTVSEENIQRRAGSAPATMTRAMQDDYVEENAKFRSDAGLKTYLVRVTDGDCCEWCTKVAGRYEYGTEPHDIYRRHDNCGCSVTYENGRQRQNVWTKKTWEVPAEDAGAPEPVRLTKEQAAAAGAPPPKVFSKEEASTIEFIHLADAGIMNDSYYLKGSAEIKLDTLDGSSAINKRFAQEYRQEYDKFTGIFGQLTNLRGVYTASYLGEEIYGGYNPQSYEITLLGVGGDDGKAKMQAIAKKKKKSGEWSTKSVYHTFRHELGHSLIKEHELTDEKWAEKLGKITEIKESIEKELTFLSDNDKMEKKGNILSKYAFDSIDEFISESVAEYVNSPTKARPTAKTVVGIILGKE